MTTENEYFEEDSPYFIQVSSHLPGPLDPLAFVHPAHIQEISYRTTWYTCGEQVLIVHHGPVAIAGYCLDRVADQDQELPPGAAFPACTYQYNLQDWRGDSVGELLVCEWEHYGEAEELPDGQGWALSYERSVHAGYFRQEVSWEELKDLKEKNKGGDQQAIQELVMYHLNGKHVFI